ncbi:MAG: ABC transporter ATP-binding protein [Buchananella hordeovulneris]|nr:ABC transporter ATP-binding protein [Buchananella hordeovulneris]
MKAARKNAPVAELTEEEAALMEKGRLAAGSNWDAQAPGKAANFVPSFKRMVGILAPHKALVIWSVLLSIISTALTVYAPKVLGQATNLIFEGFISRQIPPGVTQEQVVEGLRAAGQDKIAAMAQAMNLTPGFGIDFEALAWVLIAILAIYTVAEALAWLQAELLNRAVIRAIYALREQVEAKIHRLPLSYFDKTPRGELLSRLTNDTDNIAVTLQQHLSGAIAQILTVVGVLGMMFVLSWKLALVSMIALPLFAVIFGVIGPRSQAAFKQQWLKTGQVNTRMEESFSGHDLVHIFGRREALRQEFANDNEELFRASFKAQFLSGMMMPAMRFVGSVTYVAVAVLGALMVSGGSLTLGDVQAFIQYSQMYRDPLAQLGAMAAAVQSGVASAERIFEFLDEPEEEQDGEHAPALAAGDGTIVFDSVSFSYTEDTELIRDLTFTVKPGQTVAIVGPTGAGKTTLINLVQRFYELDGGQILLNGQNIAALRRQDVRGRTGMVLQDPWLFQGSILENIRYGRHDATDAEVIEAAKAAYVDRFVHALPAGYETLLEEDAANVSAGERQLITIARAFVARPDLLILDEATSFVDTRTELLVQKAMTALRQGRTSFVIAHRLSTIRDADLILVMENGQIVEQGNHAQLLAVDGAYARLYAAQFEGALVDDAAAGMPGE